MVITCPECSTRFNVTEERIPDAGAKLRCARCRHVFMVSQTVAEEVQPEGPEARRAHNGFFSAPEESYANRTSATESTPFPASQVAMPDDPARFSDVETNDSNSTTIASANSTPAIRLLKSLPLATTKSWRPLRRKGPSLFPRSEKEQLNASPRAGRSPGTGSRSGPKEKSLQRPAVQPSRF
jgi:predicted Zn finger-like uncharacterized protein